MGLVQKIEFDAAIRKATPLEAIGICAREADRIYRESESVGGRKWAFSQYREGWACSKGFVLYWSESKSRAQYQRDLVAHLVRNSSTLDIELLRTIVVLGLMRIDACDRSQYRTAQKTAISDDQDPTKNRRGIINVERFVSIGEELLDAQSYLARILGLCALTGRRTVEIGTTAVFEWVGPNHVRFTGQAKTRDRDDVRPYVIPTLTDAGKLIDALASIRQDKPELVVHPELFHNRCVKDLHTRAKVFGEVFSDGTAKPKDLRPAWAEIVWLLFDERQTGKALFLSRMLGHGDQDLMTAQSYDDFLIRDPAYTDG